MDLEEKRATVVRLRLWELEFLIRAGNFLYTYEMAEYPERERKAIEVLINKLTRNFHSQESREDS